MIFKVYDLMDVNCSGTNIPVISVKIKSCNASWRMNMVVMICAAVIILTVTPLAMYVGYKLKSKLFVTFSPVTNVEMDEKEFDAFISYSHEDEYYVCELTRQLEQPPDPFKICLHSRNWLPGELIIKQIVDSVKRSRTTIIVLSMAYIQSEWCTAEFQIALTHMLMRKNHKVIVIWCSAEKPADMDLEPEFKTYLKMCTYLKRNDENFLKRLELAIERL